MAHICEQVVASFRIANNGTYEVQFHDIVVWRGLAEIAAEHLTKGRLVYLSGRLHSRSWTGRDGLGRWAVEIIADDIQFLTPKPAVGHGSILSRRSIPAIALW